MTKQKLGAWRIPLTQFRRERHGDLARHHWRTSYRMARFDAMLDPKANRKLIAFRGFGTAQNAATAQTIRRRWQPIPGDNDLQPVIPEVVVLKIAWAKSILWTDGRSRKAAADRQRFLLVEAAGKGASYVNAAHAAGFPTIAAAVTSLRDGGVFRRVGIPHDDLDQSLSS